MTDQQHAFCAILARTLELDGKPAVEVQLAAPVAQDNGDHWSCAYRILGLGQPVKRLAMGIDAIQVLTLALCMIRADLDASAEAKSNRLSWLDEKRGFGFPDPRSHPDLPPIDP